MQGELKSASCLRIDLDSGEIRVDDLNSSWAALSIGGKGLLFRYLLEEMKPRLDPWLSKNVLIISSEPYADASIASDRSLQEYYRLRGWNEARVSTKVRLSSLFSSDELAGLCSGPALRGREEAPVPEQ